VCSAPAVWHQGLAEIRCPNPVRFGIWHESNYCLGVDFSAENAAAGACSPKVGFAKVVACPPPPSPSIYVGAHRISELVNENMTWKTWLRLPDLENENRGEGISRSSRGIRLWRVGKREMFDGWCDVDLSPHRDPPHVTASTSTVTLVRGFRGESGREDRKIFIQIRRNWLIRSGVNSTAGSTTNAKTNHPSSLQLRP
jgi:hypothetical protein